GYLTLLLGEPGIGKSLLSLDLAARITTNSLPPPHPPPPPPPPPPHPGPRDQVPPDQNPKDHAPGVACILAREDDEHIVRKRLAAAGANLDLLWNKIA